ncbi:inositol-pentakisphosphate 2-kinase-like [Physella acuta]|uniref:inositol-pentakisphosphate 2-kinase-like n=1 Tax=Physella acuta TaxID=109671 RepID=UPI0027DDF551|nr:inositol-pentakisphosphate 2-kinase-like [Physella acuta]
MNFGMERFFDLEYRGEGNRSMVFANPQTKQVYRLVKQNATQKIRDHLLNGVGKSYGENIQKAVCMELRQVISYMKNIMRPLLSDRYVVIPKLILLPKGFGEKAVELAGQARPAHRKNSHRDIVDTHVQCALVLPDCCFVCNPTSGSSEGHPGTNHQADENTCNRQNPMIKIISTDSLRRSSSSCSGDSQDSSTQTDQFNDSLETHFSLVDDEDDALSFQCVYGGEELEDSAPHICDEGGSRKNIPCGQFYITDAGNSKDEFSKNLKESRDDSSYTLSIEIKPKKGFLKKMDTSSIEESQVCRFCMHQYLKRKSGQWPETSGYCPLHLFSGNRSRMKHALESLIKTPQNNLKICKNGREVYGSEIRQDLSAILKGWFPINPNRRPGLVSVFLDLVIEILLSPPNSEVSRPHSKRQVIINHGLQKCDSRPYIDFDQDQSEGLPEFCVLERIYTLQSLDDLDIEGVYPLYKQLKAKLDVAPHLMKKWCLNGPYEDVSWLVGHPGEELSTLDPSSDEYAVHKVRRFLVSKTLQDCSIIVAIKPAKSIDSRQDFLRFEGDLYAFSISVVDLDPKPFEKVNTYYRQASDIAKTFAEKSFGVHRAN